MDKEPLSLSTVFPQGTNYFYGFPAELDSGFYNGCPPAIEELVAMRPSVCAGTNVKVVTFASTTTERVRRLMEDDLGVVGVGKDQIISLPEAITRNVSGSVRNEAVKRALAELIPDGSLVMAQPYIDDRLQPKYLINPQTTAWLNDKKNIRDFVPSKYRIPEFASFSTGEEFYLADTMSYEYPCAVKVTLSSAGDGVMLCKTPQELRAAQEKYKNIPHPILIQKFIGSPFEPDVKFIVPQAPGAPCSIVGHSREITGPNGEYQGGVILNNEKKSEVIERIEGVLLQEILPILRQKGWFGVGGVDVLIDDDGNFYFSDFNCRMTATMAQQLQVRNGTLGAKSVAVFNGFFSGDIEEFRRTVVPHARHGGNNQKLNVVSLAEDKDDIRIHGGVLFDQPETLEENIMALQRYGIHAAIFSRLTTS